MSTRAIITAIEITRHRLPLDPPFRASWDTQPRTTFDAAIVRVHTDIGVTGIGSGDMMLGFAGHEHLFVGHDAMQIERHWRILNNISFHWGRCWPLDLALWDLAGKLAGQPVWKLLGGLSDRVRAYASSGTLRGASELADAAERYLAQGFPALKIRFHRGDWRDDVKALQAVRARVGNKLALMVDCNQGWRMSWDAYPSWTLKEAVEVARELERVGVYWMEEPLHRGDREGMRRLARPRRHPHRRRRNDARTLRIPRSDNAKAASTCCSPTPRWSAESRGFGGSPRWRRSTTSMFTPHTWTNGMGVVANAHLTAGLCDAPFMEFPYDPPEWDLKRPRFSSCKSLCALTPLAISCSRKSPAWVTNWRRNGSRRPGSTEQPKASFVAKGRSGWIANGCRSTRCAPSKRRVSI